MRHMKPGTSVTGADMERALRSFAADRIRLAPGMGKARGLLLRSMASLSIGVALMPQAAPATLAPAGLVAGIEAPAPSRVAFGAAGQFDDGDHRETQAQAEATREPAPCVEVPAEPSPAHRVAGARSAGDEVAFLSRLGR